MTSRGLFGACCAEGSRKRDIGAALSKRRNKNTRFPLLLLCPSHVMKDVFLFGAEGPMGCGADIAYLSPRQDGASFPRVMHSHIAT